MKERPGMDWVTPTLLLSANPELYNQLHESPWKTRLVHWRAVLRRIFESVLLDAAYLCPRFVHAAVLFAADVWRVGRALARLAFSRWVLALLVAAAVLLY